jgi:hypothetical protein
MIRYDDLYSSVTREKRQKKAEDEDIISIIEADRSSLDRAEVGRSEDIKKGVKVVVALPLPLFYNTVMTKVRSL